MGAIELATAYVSMVPSARGIAGGISKELSGPTNKAAGIAGAAAGKTFGSKFSGALRSVAKVGALGLAGAAFAATKLVIDAVGAAEESRKIAEQTNAVIESTGKAAHVSAKDVGLLAQQLSFKAGIDDELIQSGANVLLTFTKIRNEVGKGNDIFDQATTVALDMSVALGQDLQSSVIQIGKALNDPIKGLTSLQRVGVAFTDQQKEQIKTLVESGDVLGAQKIILQELTTEFGGSAAAQATATDRLKVAFGNISEQIGGVLLPYVDAFSTWMLTKGTVIIERHLIPAFQSLVGWINDSLIPAIGDLWGWVRDSLIPALGDLGQWVEDNVIPPLQTMWTVFTEDIIPALESVATWINDHVVPALGDLNDALKGTNDEAGDTGPSLAGWVVAFGAVVAGAAIVAGALAPVVGGLKLVATTFGFLGFAATTAFNLILKILPFSHIAALAFIFRDQITNAVGGAWDRIRDSFTQGIDFLRRNWPLIVAIIVGPLGVAVLGIVKHWDKIRGFVTGAATAVLNFLRDNWVRIIAFMVLPFVTATLQIIKYWDQIRGAFQAGVNVVLSIWRTAWDTVWAILQGAWRTIGDFFASLPGRIRAFFAAAGTWLLEGGKAILRGLWQGALFMASQFFGYLSRIPGRIRDTFAGAGRWLLEAGKRILQGLWDGLKDKWRDVTDWIGGLGKKIVDLKGPPKKDLQMLRPAGRNIMQGFFEELKKGQGPIFRLMKRLGVFIQMFFAGRGVGGGALSGLEDRFESIVRQILKLGRGQIKLVSGFRSSSQQARLYARYLAGTGNLAAPPGRSKHERGLAVDFGGNRGLYTRLAHQFGLVAPVRGEPWHWQPTWAGQTRSYYGTGGVVRETGPAFLHRRETVFTPDQVQVLGAAIGAGGSEAGIYIARIDIRATTLEEGRAAAKGFLEVLDRRRIRTDARIA